MEGLDERARNWIYAQSDITDDGAIVVKDPAAAKVVDALKGPIKAQIEAGLLKPEYHKDQLSLGLGTPEHGGRVRAISSSASWKEGFSSSSSHLYKKHIFYRKELEEQYREDWRRELILFTRDQQQGCLSSELQAAMQVALNSMSRDTSTSTQAETDAITEETPCELHVPFGYKGKTIMVATGRAIPG